MDDSTISRSLIRRAENTELPLESLEAIAALRRRLDELEGQAIQSARTKRATIEDIANAMDLTPQAIYYRRRKGDVQRKKRGRPRKERAERDDATSRDHT